MYIIKYRLATLASMNKFKSKKKEFKYTNDKKQ